MKKRISLVLCAIVLLSFCLPATALTIDPVRSSMTLVYQHEGIAYEGLQIMTYKVADVEDDYIFTLCGPFAQYPVNINGIQSQSEWNIICQTLESYIWADSLNPSAIAFTDASGTVKFDGLEPGLYLTMPILHLDMSGTTEFDAFLTAIPGQDAYGNVNYHVTSYPKSSSYSPEDGDTIIYKILKQWKDSGYQEFRPDSIQVDIFRNGEFTGTVSLSAENNWSHGWVAPDDGAVWTAVERDVPADYTVTIEYKGDTIILTNVREGKEDPPPTGDTTDLKPYMLALCLSGCVLILLALLRKKGK